MSRTYHCEHAWLGVDGVRDDVLVVVEGDRIVYVRQDVSADAGVTSTRLPGLTIPGLANAHSHAFHRALRSHTQRGSGSFWTWREQMYDIAARLDPDSYHQLARAVFAEMALAGITCVGEFHYLHHGPDSRPYDDQNAMGHAMVAAARDAGIRLTLLDACYLTGGIGKSLTGPQVRFTDGSAHAWAERAEAMHAAYRGADDVKVGAAVHSVRAVPADQIPLVVDWSMEHDAPLHAHLSEQQAENEAAIAAYGRTPTHVLADAGLLGPRSTVVHATHLVTADIARLGSSGTCVCMCPTTERDLADGIGPARTLADAGSPLSLGSDGQSVVDLFEEARGVELDERLGTQQRGHFSAGELLLAATNHASLGWRDAGMIAPGALADLVTVRTDSVRTAGAGATAESVVFAASAADVTHVVVGGQEVVRDGVHVLLGDVGRLLEEAVRVVRGSRTVRA